ncbi:MAG TPA: SpoIIE family protein phosphatase [Fimbriimonas sp.]|nr:SpoIIE family protein phosphatase [Fimbriimonas sp.]
MKILVVDDDELTALILSENLRGMGHEVTNASDGEEGWELFQKGEFPIIILDWMMPRLDGLGLSRRIRHRLGSIYTYIILLTGRTDREDRIQGLEAGADDFLIKPLDPGELRARLTVASRIIESERQLHEIRKMEMDLGAEIQKKLLFGATPEAVTGIDVQSISVPSKSVAGDFLDFYPYANGILDVLVGDVMGKGVPAAMIAAGVKSAIEKQLLSLVSRGVGLPSPERVLSEASVRVVPDLMSLNSFATLAYVRFYGNQKQMSYVNCGHPNLILWRALSDRSELLPPSTVPLGFLEDSLFPETDMQLEVGDLVCIYSDGLSDQFGGPDGLSSWIGVRACLPLAQIRAELLDASKEDQKDDATFVLIRIRGDERSEMWSEYGVMASLREEIKRKAKGLSQDKLGELTLAVQEAGSNALRHARPNHPNLPFGFQVVNEPERVRVGLRYPGQPFTPGPIKEVTVDLDTEGGLGLSIIARAVDEFHYGRDGDWNVVELIKRKG